MLRIYISIILIGLSVGLMAQSCIEITEPDNLTVACAKIDISTSGGNNGEVSVVASGGTSPYTYLWSDGATTSSITGLIAGTYSVTVTDNSGCFLSCQSIINNPSCVPPNAGVDQVLTCSNNVAPTSTTLSAATAGTSWQLKTQPSGAIAAVNNSGVVSGMTKSGDYIFELVSDTDANCKDEIKITVPTCSNPCATISCGTISVRKL